MVYRYLGFPCAPWEDYSCFSSVPLHILCPCLSQSPQLDLWVPLPLSYPMSEPAQTVVGSVSPVQEEHKTLPFHWLFLQPLGFCKQSCSLDVNLVFQKERWGIHDVFPRCFCPMHSSFADAQPLLVRWAQLQPTSCSCLRQTLGSDGLVLPPC